MVDEGQTQTIVFKFQSLLQKAINQAASRYERRDHATALVLYVVPKWAPSGEQCGPPLLDEWPTMIPPAYGLAFLWRLTGPVWYIRGPWLQSRAILPNLGMGLSMGLLIYKMGWVRGYVGAAGIFCCYWVFLESAKSLPIVKTFAIWISDTLRFERIAHFQKHGGKLNPKYPTPFTNTWKIK